MFSGYETLPRDLRIKKVISATLLSLLIIFVTAANIFFIWGRPLAYSAAFGAIDAYFAVLLVVTLLQIIYSDPGYITCGKPASAGNGSYNSLLAGPTGDSSTTHDERFCRACGITKPQFTHHCSRCGRCVELYDHHCNVFASCFGRFTVGYVFKFLITVGAYLTITAIQLITVNLAHFRAWKHAHFWARFGTVYCAILSVYALIIGPTLIFLAFRLCGDQMLRGVGQIERRAGVASNG